MMGEIYLSTIIAHYKIMKKNKNEKFILHKKKAYFEAHSFFVANTHTQTLINEKRIVET